MPSQRKRIGFLPSEEVHEIIEKLCTANEFSQSKVTGLLVEEALRSRGVLNESYGQNHYEEKDFINFTFDHETFSENNKSSLNVDEYAVNKKIFVLIIFLILMINKAISKAVTYSGIGTIDKFFGMIFGIVISYVFVVCLFTAANIVYNYEKWPLNLKDSFTFPMVEKGSKYLIKEFPNEKEYQDAKEKVQDI